MNLATAKLTPAPKLTDLGCELSCYIEMTLGQGKAHVFNEQLEAYTVSRGLNLQQLGKLSPTQQIKHLNGFFTAKLNKVHTAKATELKAWLCEGSDLDSYVFAFEKHWVHSADKLALFE